MVRSVSAGQKGGIVCNIFKNADLGGGRGVGLCAFVLRVCKSVHIPRDVAKSPVRGMFRINSFRWDMNGI